VQDNPTAHAVITAALAQPLPGDQQDVHQRAVLIEAALIQHGHLPEPQGAAQAPSQDEVEEIARWLAERGAHPRHVVVEDGWKRLIESPVDVDLAGACAQRRVGNHGLDEVLRAVDVLKRWHRQ
jgi:hypothetical protein